MAIFKTQTGAKIIVYADKVHYLMEHNSDYPYTKIIFGDNFIIVKGSLQETHEALFPIPKYQNQRSLSVKAEDFGYGGPR